VKPKGDISPQKIHDSFKRNRQTPFIMSLRGDQDNAKENQARIDSVRDTDNGVVLFRQERNGLRPEDYPKRI
jgi:hypothetical protein